MYIRKLQGLFLRGASLAVIFGLAMMNLPAAHANQGGHPNDHASDNAQSHKPDVRQYPAVFIPDLVPVTAGTVSYLQFTNIGTQAAAAAVTIYATDTGAQLATWTSASIPPLGSALVDVGAIASEASPVLTATQAASAVNLRIGGTLHGTVQVLQLAGGEVSNLSGCAGAKYVIGGVPGPGAQSFNANIHISNPGETARHAELTLYDSATGAKLGSWTSPDIAAHSSINTSTSAIAAASTPAVPATVTSFTLAERNPLLDVDVLAVAKTGGVPVSLNAACRLRGSGAPHASGEPTSNDDDNSDH